MSELADLIDALAGGLRPVRRVRNPVWRALGWLAAAAALAAVLAAFANRIDVARQLAVTDIALATLGAASTAVLATIAAFLSAMVDRARGWAWLPLPPMLLWLGASGLGCLRAPALPGEPPATLDDTRHCLMFILGLSVPLSIGLILLLRQAFTLRPGLTAALAGLAAAATSATLLALFHPYDASVLDVVVHVAAVAIVVGVNRAAGGRVLQRAGT